MNRLYLIYLMLFVLNLTGCSDNDLPQVNKFEFLDALEEFDKDEIVFYVNDEEIRNNDLELRTDSGSVSDNIRNGKLRLHMVEYAEQYVTIDVKIESLGAHTYHIYGTKETIGRSRYEVDAELSKKTLPYTNKLTRFLKLNLSYTVLSRYAGNSYEIDFSDAPFDFKFYDGDSADMEGVRVDYYTIQKRTKDLINRDMARRGTKVRLAFSKNGQLSVDTNNGESDGYTHRFTARYWWDDESDHRFVMNLQDFHSEFHNIFISSISYEDVREVYSPLFYNVMEFDIFGTPLPDLISSNIEITGANRTHSSILGEMAQYRQHDVRWSSEEVKYLRESAYVVAKNKNQDLSLYPGWTIKCSTNDFGNWDN